MSEGYEKGGFLMGLSNDLADAVEQAGRYVVRVAARKRLSASGILWSADGLVVTADHVVEQEEGIKVGLADGRELPARLLGRDPGTDLALLKLDGAVGGAAEAAEPSTARVGSLVLAVGRPGEGGPMATIGIVSARTGPWRTWRGGMLDSLIQTDVTLYPGFSGGPLVDASGRVVGMNTSLLARGVSTAVPAETVARVAQAIATQGRVRRGYLGVGTQPVDLPTAMASSLGLTQETGLMVVRVEPGGPAEGAGLMIGDVMVAVGGQPVGDADELHAHLGPDRVGGQLTLRLIRGGQMRDLAVTVGERP